MVKRKKQNGKYFQLNKDIIIYFLLVTFKGDFIFKGKFLKIIACVSLTCLTTRYSYAQKLYDYN